MTKICFPENQVQPEAFLDATKAVDRLEEIYKTATAFLCSAFNKAMENGAPDCRMRAFYPEIRIKTTSFAQVDTRLSYGHVAEVHRHRRSAAAARGAGRG